MKKFREKLLEERGILKEEERHLERRYEILENVSEQCKKLVSESYEGLVSASGGGSAIQMGSHQQRVQPFTSTSVLSPN